MTDISSFGKGSGAGPLGAAADRVIHQATSQDLTPQNAKIEKSAKDFESILLGSWLQQAEQTFATLPGGEDDQDADAGKDQFQGMAMQSLGASLTMAGGIGIAKLISKQLHKAEDTRVSTSAQVTTDQPIFKKGKPQ